MGNKFSGISEVKITVPYFLAAAACIVIAHIFGIVLPHVLIKEPLTGKLILWTHLHTMGIISPIFFGIFFYNLQSRYGTEIRFSKIILHFVLSNISLLFFLYSIASREGSPGLTFSALSLFISNLYFIFLSASILYKHGRNHKENRNFEFWIDSASLYFLVQALLFGFVLAANLSHHFLRRSELHSLRLHSHSGITGFWLLQTLNFFYRSAIVSNPENVQWNKYVKLSAACVGSGLFLWTSVHDRFSWFFFVYYALAGASLIFLLLYTFKIRINVPGLKQMFLTMALFMLTAYLIAGILIFNSSEEFIYGNHLPFVYAYIIFYGIFVLLPVPFLFTSGLVSINDTEKLWKLIKWPWRIFLKLVVLFLATVILENTMGMRVILVLLLTDYIYLIFSLSKFINGTKGQEGWV